MGKPDDLARRARRARRDAESIASATNAEWYRSEKTRIASDPDLSISEREYALRELLMEFGRRSSRALRKAKRDNTQEKVLAREIREEVDADHNRRTPGRR